MNKKYIFSLVVALASTAGFTSCNDDTEPRIDTGKDFNFVLNTPPMANQFIDLSTGGNMIFTVSQPDYGITVAPDYGLEISLKPDFTQYSTAPVYDADGEEHILPPAYTLTLVGQTAGQLTAELSDIAKGVNALYGAFDEETYQGDYEGPLYVRATAHVGGGTAAVATAVISNIVTLSQVKGYAEFGSSGLYLSVPGGANGWTHEPVLFSEDGVTYKGFAAVSGGFKITDGDWDGTGNWGASAEGEEGLVAETDGDGNVTYTASLIQNSQDNFNNTGAVLEPGLYFFVVTVTDMQAGDGQQAGTMTITPIKSIAICGDFNGWDTGTAIEMTNSSDFTVWTADAAVTSSGWKFIFNGGWGINLGGTSDNLTFDGANLDLAGSQVTLTLSQHPWTCSVQ